MATIILELSFLLYKTVSLHNIQDTIQTTFEKYNIDKYYFDFEIEDKKRIEQKGVYTVHFKENKINLLDIVKFLREIKTISNVYLECVYRDNISCDIIYASKFYLKNMEKSYQQQYIENKRVRSYSETEFEILRAIQSIFKNNKNFFKNEHPPKTFDEYLKMCEN
jgi:hypothetical protein